VTIVQLVGLLLVQDRTNFYIRLYTVVSISVLNQNTLK